jgi:hypothetical protein
VSSIFACAGASAAFVADCLGTVGIAERFADSRWFLPLLFTWWIVAGFISLSFILAMRREARS